MGDKTQTLYRPVLNTDEIKNLDDCKKILSFLCVNALKPIPEGLTYIGFNEVKDYFYVCK